MLFAAEFSDSKSYINAAKNGNFILVNNVIQQEKNKEHPQHHAALMAAISTGKLAIIDLLLVASRYERPGIKLDLTAQNMAALKLAIQQKQEKIIALLLEQPEVQNKLTDLNPQLLCNIADKYKINFNLKIAKTVSIDQPVLFFQYRKLAKRLLLGDVKRNITSLPSELIKIIFQYSADENQAISDRKLLNSIPKLKNITLRHRSKSMLKLQ